MAVKKKTTEKGDGKAIVSDKVKDRSNDPFFVKKRNRRNAGSAMLPV